MKIILSVILAFATSVVSALDVESALGVVHLQTRTTETCGDPTLAVPFYRTYNPSVAHHLYCMDLATTLKTSGWVYQALAAFVFATQEESTIVLYHMVNPTTFDRIYTTNTTEVNVLEKNGYGQAGGEPFYYIYSTQICGSVPFYRLSNSALRDHFFTTLETERIEAIASQGYADQGIAGYVFAPEPTQC
ncbi:hypothetical protein FB451DRAFT_1258450 [Mycena latifolia]|nr:hypothetical protein FB451DRAFT_1258450 [Mycena latifolia]